MQKDRSVLSKLVCSSVFPVSLFKFKATHISSIHENKRRTLFYLDLGACLSPLLLKKEKIPDVKMPVSHMCVLHMYLQSGRNLYGI